MKELILHIASLSEHDPHFGAVKLNKILFYADFLSYLKRGKSITEQPYFALAEGPAPKRLLPIREEMEHDGDIAVRRIDAFGLPNPQTRVVPLREPDYTKISARELALVDTVVERFRSKTGRDLTNASHKFLGWRHAIQKGEKTAIPFAAVLFDPEGFLGIQMPDLPQRLIDHGRKLHEQTVLPT